MVMLRPLLPCSTTPRASGDRSRTGMRVEKPWARPSESRRLKYHELEVPARIHGATAPSDSDRSLLGMTMSGSGSSRKPRPVHDGQAPCGLLKLNVRGSISPMLTPQ